jgi:hypothetical protein
LAVIRKERLLEVCRLLRDDPDLGYLYISDITAIDWLPHWEKARNLSGSRWSTTSTRL